MPAEQPFPSREMPCLSDLLARGREDQRAGRLAQAECVYREALRLEPANVEALGLLASLCQELGRPEDAARYYSEAIGRAPGRAEFHNNLGIALTMLGRTAEGLACFRDAIRLRPDYPEAHNNLGSVHRRLGNYDDAVASFREAVRLKPLFAEGHNNLGLACLNTEQLDLAVASFREAVRLRPDMAEAQKNLGIALRDRGDIEAAVAAFQEALRLKPDFADALISLGLALMHAGNLDEAIAVYERALRLRPDFAEGHNNLGIMLMEQGKVEQARAQYRRTLRLKPDYADAHWNYALVLLLLGDFEQGWLEYEWRRKNKPMMKGTVQQPLWDGSPLDGKTILLFTEQGLGDAIQFIRYAGVLKRQGARIVVFCRSSMVSLLSTCPGVDQFVTPGMPLPRFDFHAPLMSVPGILETGLDSIPTDVPYLRADPKRIERWDGEVRKLDGFKVGICWQGDPKYPGDRNRSIPLQAFGTLARIPNVRLISLQKGPGSEQVAQVSEDFEVLDWGPRLDQEGHSFVDTAAVIQSVDLIVTSDTAIAHLAGALAAPVWVALGHTPDWRYLLEREDSPWYRTMRLFRGGRAEGWEPLFDRMASQLEEHIRHAARRRGSPRDKGKMP